MLEEQLTKYGKNGNMCMGTLKAAAIKEQKQ